MGLIEFARQFPIGAEIDGDKGVHFRIWAPRAQAVSVILNSGTNPSAHPLTAEPEGYHAGLVTQASVASLYQIQLDHDPFLYPDPASRYQPDGPFGPSQVVDAAAFEWSDSDWPGVSTHGQVIYEMHVGAFTKEGTWEAAAKQLPALAELGITIIEVMPIAEFPGDFGWGYDGVNMFAPSRLYGSPDDLRRFVDRAHRHGIGVILDVVYNHLGPDGNFLGRFSDTYFTDQYKTDWGEPLNFHGRGSAPVREFFLANAAYWIREFHLDGLRLDATQNIYDDAEGPEHILAEVAKAVRDAAGGRGTWLVAENEPQDTTIVRPPDAGGFGIDALWNDDFHHSAMVALTGRKEAYYSDYLGVPQEFVSAAKWGYLYQGQHYQWQKQRRGTPALDLSPRAFVSFIQNHDQVANSARGQRVHELTSPARLRAMTALVLLGPATPMLFMGQEFASSAPFLYFADHKPDLAEMVSTGRREFLRQFPSLAQPTLQAGVPEPAARETFERCKLDFSERDSHSHILALHRDLLRIRRTDSILGGSTPFGVDGSVLSGDAFLLRYFGADGDRLLIVNLGRDLRFSPAPDPLLAPPASSRWRTLWSSEDVAYGGVGTPEVESSDGAWEIPGESAVFLGAG